MAEYHMKSIDDELVKKLKIALSKYKEQLKNATCFRDVSEYHRDLSKAFSEVVDARSVAIDNSYPRFEIDIMKFNPEYKITILLDRNIEDLLNEVCKILGTKNDWSK